VSAWIDDLERHMQTGDVAARWPTPGHLAHELDPATVQTPALDVIDEFLVRIASTPDGRGILIMPPQEGKSQRTSRRFPLWQLHRDPECRIAIASYEQGVARRWGRAVRDDIGQHPELGLLVRRDLASQTEWQLAGHDGGIYSVGIGGALTGRAVDLLIIDDPIKDRQQADSPTYRQRVWDWWESVASTRLSPGASVVLILTRWHDDDLAGRLLKSEDADEWEVKRIPAQAVDSSQLPESDPEHGKPDPLGRAPGEFLVSARGRTVEQWQAIRRRVGSRTWNALYQGRPTAEAGDVLERGWWRRYSQVPWLERDDGSRVIIGQFDELIQSWDLAFKDKATSDYVAGHVWLRRGADLFLVDRVHRRMGFPDTVRAIEALTAKWPQAMLKLIEDKANGPAVIASLNRRIPGIVPEEPTGSKLARAYAVAPLVEAGNVWLPESRLAPWADEFIEECAAFPNGANDDDVDAFSQAANRLVIMPLLSDGTIYTADDFDEELAGFSISPY